MDQVKKQKHPIFNGEYEILSSLGEGNTSKVYLARSIKILKNVWHSSFSEKSSCKEIRTQSDQSSKKFRFSMESNTKMLSTSLDGDLMEW